MKRSMELFMQKFSPKNLKEPTECYAKPDILFLRMILGHYILPFFPLIWLTLPRYGGKSPIPSTKKKSRALRIITFADFRADSNPIYRDLNILKLRDQIAIQNCLFVHDSLNNNSPSCFSDYFNLTRQIHPLHTRNASLGCLYPKDSNTTRYGLYSITTKCISIWNALSRALNTDLATFSRYQLKCKLFHYLKKDY